MFHWTEMKGRVRDLVGSDVRADDHVVLAEFDAPHATPFVDPESSWAAITGDPTPPRWYTNPSEEYEDLVFYEDPWMAAIEAEPAAWVGSLPPEPRMSFLPIIHEDDVNEAQAILDAWSLCD